MRIPSFVVGAHRNLSNVSCDAVPRVMIVAGPNGAGKSTLLNALRTAPPAASSGVPMPMASGSIIYVGPHRASQRSPVMSRALLNQRIKVEDLMSAMGTLPGIEGLNFGGRMRDAWDHDAAGSYVKFAICQVAMDRRAALVSRYDKAGELKKGEIPDVWAPLEQLTNSLLPHLHFANVDDSNINEVRVLWRTHEDGVLVDLDDLSSGEKAVIQMLYPLIEYRIARILDDIRGTVGGAGRSEIAVLIDEPELHLHPNLQIKVIDYFRELSATEAVQFILVTQSPIIVEYASADELFVLRPKELVASGENQLRRVADDDKLLAYIRSVFGTTSNLTALQPVVVVEGENNDDVKRAVPDRRLYRALSEKFDRVTLIAGGGKSDVLRLRTAIESLLTSFSKDMSVVALVDRDQGSMATSPPVFSLGVAMIENLLIDPESLFEAIASIVHKTAFRTADDLGSALDAVLSGLTNEEIERRAIRALGLFYYRPQGPLAEVPAHASRALEEFKAKYSGEAVGAVFDAAKRTVDEIIAAHRRREEFHGKRTLEEFFKSHLHGTGMSKEIFLYEAARYARERRSVTEFFDELFSKIEAASSSETALAKEPIP